ncbi:TolC family outer membrane protein [Trinickia soli]|uniref:Porin n=1 Tax=Trinickia soli TaxID=380675 RepID=A0A2N7W672_9BURK|nr:TolC family outer membrane protein [Trinickia soli]PMS24898.1 porin [Trinickia soli]CAB3645554.1 Outer membrane protein TolC [Trinickia soli]
MSHGKRAWAIVLVAASTLAHAQTDLLGAARAALAHDPVYASALAQNLADATKRKQGRAGFLPQVYATGNVRYGTTDQETTGAHFAGGGFGASNGIAFDTRAAGATGAGWAITIKENLYSASKNADARQMNDAADAGDASLRLARQTLLLQVAQAYFAVLAAQDDVAALQSIRDAAREAGNIAQGRFDTGDAAITDVKDAHARADLAQAQMLAAQTTLDLKRAELRDLTGGSDNGSDGALRPLADSDQVESLSAGNFADWQSRAMADNPLIELRRLGIDSARAETSRYRPGAGTTVDAFASYIGDRMNGAGYGGNSSMRSNSAVVGIMITIPLYTGGLRSAKAEESAALLNRAGLDEDAARVAVAREVRQAFLGMQSAQTQVKALTQALRSAELQLDANRTGFQAGDRPSVDVLNAEQALFGTRRDLAVARYQVVLNRLRLAAAAGQLDEDQLAQINALLH